MEKIKLNEHTATARLNRLLKAAYIIVILDGLLALFFIGVAIFVARECPGSMTEHMLFLFHFTQLLAILSVMDEWHKEWRDDEEGTGQVKAYSPSLWIASSLISLVGDVCFLVYQLTAARLECDTLRILHIILDSLGIAVCVFSIAWFIIVASIARASLTKQQQMQMQRIRVDTLLEKPYF